MFKELNKGEISKNEERISNFWKENEILEKSIENREKNFVFYDGPATANGFPGLHHMVAKFLKDSFCKYKTMKGYKVLRKVGWDTHGLPVELAVEKELGFENKTDIEKYGIEKFNKKCRESVWKNEKAFSDLTEKMGQFIDLENPYVTYDNNYIETEWWILKKFFDEGLFYEGHKIVPHCPRCGTGLASHEVAQGYKEVSVDTVIVTMKKKDEDCYFLVWTTTPWTLSSNVALCVNPNEEYVKVESMGYKFILAKKLMNKVLGEDVKILETYKGKDLEYTEYEQLIPDLKVDKKAFFVTCDNYVTMEDGTGVVHLAPAFGEDDSHVGAKYNLPYLNPVGEDGTYKEGMWKGKNVFEADLEVIKYLKQNDKLFKKQKIKHNYPHCWRCGTPLIYYSKPSFYLEVTKIKDRIIKANKKVNWYPSYVGEKRFGNWLENLNDWAISRNRYWGTPLPLWRCECGHEIMIGSREELVEKAVEKIDETIDLHRPYVDDVHIKCECGKQMKRVTDVIDCWFDSGSMPFAQYHYPFENKALWEEQFPADFIAEGVDQTRGWFYTLLVISVFVTGKSPYKNVLVNDLLLDSEGKKMSKSRGNIVEPFTTMKNYGADVVRFYLPYTSPVWTPLKFDINGLKEVHSKFFNPLKNTYSFYTLYANIDKVDPREYEIDYDSYEQIDKWLISKYNKLIKNLTEYYEDYDLHKVVKELTNFVSEDLSNWYIRRNRDRFWGSNLDSSKKCVYKVTYEVLLGLSKLIAPITPFLAEELYQNLTEEKISVHLSDFPKCDESKINLEIEKQMDLVRSLISLGRNVREEEKIKVRQPISEIILDGKNEEILKELTDLIKEEPNVKSIVFEQDLSKYMNFVIRPNFKEAGKILGSKMKDFTNYLNNLKEEEITKIRQDKTIIFEGQEISENLLDIKILSKDNMKVAMENDNFIILNTTLTDELIKEGFAREIVSKVQNLRKEKDFNIEDRIKLYYYSEDNYFDSVFTDFEDYIKKETLSISLINDKKQENKYNINDKNIYLDVERIEK